MEIIENQKGVIVEITETLTKQIFVPDAASIEDGEKRVISAYNAGQIILDANCIDGCAEFSSRKATTWDHASMYDTLAEL